MQDRFAPIGVTDSGIGGLTVVRELQRVLPGEDVIYFGDNANCPYGNKTEAQIFSLGRGMLRYLEQQGVKCVATACNTTSSMVERLQAEVSYPVVSIVAAAAQAVISAGYESVGLLATEFTVKSGKYEELIHLGAPNCRVIGKGSPDLAALVDRGDFDRKAINEEITCRVGEILKQGRIDALILGCTHYPLVEENFHTCYPGIPLVNPALAQAMAVRALLLERDQLNEQKQGKFIVCTSGEPKLYEDVCRRMGIRRPTVIRRVSVPVDEIC